jgi:beta-galactosidase
VVYSNNKGDKPYWLREYGDTVDNWTDQQSSSRVARGWGEGPLLEQAQRHAQMFDRVLSGADRKPALCAVDLWAGVDAYRGYHHQPFLGGPYDLFRLPKFDAYMFQSQRDPALHIPGLNDGPMVFIANYATFQSPSTVMVFSNCQQVRLSQNGKEVATQKPVANMPGLSHPPFLFNVGQFSSEQTTMFMTGVARPGTRIGELTAEGLIDGKVVATAQVQAPGVPCKLVLQPDLDGRDITADGSDWVRVYAHICDARGTTFPYGDDEVTFTVDGPAELITSAHAANNPARAEAGIATALIRAGTSPGDIKVTATAFGLAPAEVTIQSKPAARVFVP